MNEIKVNENLFPVDDVKPIPKMQLEFDIDFIRQIDIVLNPFYERFAQEIVKGKTATEAYYLASKLCRNKELKRKTCTEKGSKLLSNNDVVTRIRQLHRVVTEQFVMSDVELHKRLTDIIRNPIEKTSDRINAIKLLAQIKGMAKPDTNISTSQHFVNLQVEVVESKNNNLRVIENNG